MRRLTTDKAVENMDMVELAHNCCYAKDRKARYRDYDMDMDAREFAKNLLVNLADDAFIDDSDETFDGVIHDYLQYGTDNLVGLIALFYRNLWAMADLRETLKAYEDLEEQCIEENQCGLRELLLKWKAFFDDIAELYEYRKAEEQGLLLRLPCKVGDTVYVIPSQVNYDLNILSRYTENNRVYAQVVDSMRMWRNGKYCLSTCEGLRIVLSETLGETWFLTREEAENALAGLAKTSVFAEKGGAE